MKEAQMTKKIGELTVMVVGVDGDICFFELQDALSIRGFERELRAYAGQSGARVKEIDYHIYKFYKPEGVRK